MTPSIDTILRDVIERRAAGEAVPDAQVLAAHPESATVLAEQLDALRSVRLAVLEARRSHTDAISSSSAPTPASDWPRVLGYFLLSEAGRGAQASVYLAVHEITGRKVALKVVGHEAGIVSSSQRSRFGREADLMAAIDHPHVVKIIDRGRTTAGAHFLTMDYIEGPALDDWLSERRTSSNRFERDVATLFRKIALAVDDVHKHGIVHRDLKPTNIRIDRHDDPHVLDFGLARVQSVAAEFGVRARTTNPYTTVTGQVVGSLPWASPEQAAGRIDEVDRQSDVYSLGVMLYHAIAGEFPYPVEVELRQLLENIARSNPRPPIRLGYRGRPPCDRRLEAIVFKAFAKDKVDRYPSAKALADDLDGWLRGGPVVADVARRERRRRTSFVVFAAALLLAGTSLIWVVSSRPAPARVLSLPTETNSIGMSMFRLPPGPVIVGSPLQELGRQQNERQYATSVNRPFWLAAREVTRGQYRAVMGHVPPDSDTAIAAEALADDLPVTNVSWHDAVEFCRRLSSVEGRHYRLPTEIEWEYAARAGTTGPFGASLDANMIGWHLANSNGSLRAPGGKWPNRWGFLDMHGNAAEWCADLYGPIYPATHSVDLRQPEQDHPRVVRGGSVEHALEHCRSAFREPISPQYSGPSLGFRVAMEDPGAPASQ